MERREVMQQQEMSFVARGKPVTNCSVTIYNYVSLSLKQSRTCRGEDMERGKFKCSVRYRQCSERALQISCTTR